MDDQSTETTTDTSYHHHGGHLSMNRKIVVIILSALLVATTVFLIIYIWPILSHYIRRAIPVSQQKIDRRNRTIDQWVICKLVKPHDKMCTLIQELEDLRRAYDAENAKSTEEANGSTSVLNANQDESSSRPYDHPPSPKNFCNRLSSLDATEHDDDLDHEHDEREQECSICLEIFNVDDKVSWSINEECEHVFHHECIKGWLLSHVNCPFCRRLYMPVDATRSKLSQDKLKELAVEKKKRWERTYFCVEDGLCVVGPFSKKELPQGSIAGAVKKTGRVNFKNGGVAFASTTQSAPTHGSNNSSKDNRSQPENDASPPDDEEEEIVFVRDDPSDCEMGLGRTLTSEETSEVSTVSSDDSSPVDEVVDANDTGCENEMVGNNKNNNNTQDVLSYREEHPSHLEITTTEMGDGNSDVDRKHSKESPPRFTWRRSNLHVSSRLSDIEACSGSAAEEKPSLGDPLSFDHEETIVGPEFWSNV